MLLIAGMGVMLLVLGTVTLMRPGLFDEFHVYTREAKDADPALAKMFSARTMRWRFYRRLATLMSLLSIVAGVGLFAAVAVCQDGRCS